MRRVLAALTCGALATTALAAETDGFRSWTHVKSMVIVDKAQKLYGFHNVYGNDKAVAALKGDGQYAEGAAFAISFYDVVSQDGALVQGKKLKDVFMRKDEAAAETGGWAFSAATPDGKPIAVDARKGCFECHVAGASKSGFVFSKWVE
jgi:hypothetical protein